jgi:hypothetical protein
MIWTSSDGSCGKGRRQWAAGCKPRNFQRFTIMKKVLMAAALLSLLAGCVVVPARRGYVAAPTVVAPPVVVVHPTYGYRYRHYYRY